MVISESVVVVLCKPLLCLLQLVVSKVEASKGCLGKTLQEQKRGVDGVEGLFSG